MGNTSSSVKNNKNDYSSLLGTEAWTNLNKKWSNIPGGVIDFESFFRIIKYSYEGIVSEYINICRSGVYINRYITHPL